MRQRKHPRSKPSINSKKDISQPTPPDVASKVGQNTLLVLWDDLPTFLRDNEFIHGSYRPQSNSYRKSVASLKYLHNQTGNIYTHVAAAISTVIISKFLLRYLHFRFPAASQEDVVVLGIWFLGMMPCFVLSATFHTVCNHSPDAHHFWLTLDFLGIVVVDFTAFVPGIWYTFHCETRETRIYWIAVRHSNLSIPFR